MLAAREGLTPERCSRLGLARLPDVATVSRCLAEASTASIERMRRLCRELVLERLVALIPRRLTLDFDGSVLSTGRWAEGAAVGFNRKKKGQRSYYPLFCTVAQTGQVFDLLHRPGNVHDSRGAKDFLLACIGHGLLVFLDHSVSDTRAFVVNLVRRNGMPR